MGRHAVTIAVLAGIGAFSTACAQDRGSDHHPMTFPAGVKSELLLRSTPDLLGTLAKPGDSTLESAMRLASEPPRFDEPFNYSLVFPEAPSQSTKTHPSQELLDMIASWLGENFDLRAYAERPRVEFVPAAKLVALRYRGLALDREPYHDRERRVEPLVDAPRIEGLYDDRSRVIYLPESWRGVAVAEISVLVHEMVHHLQNLGSVKFSCPEEREKLAYKAQDKWLAVFGKSLADEFDLDPMTLFAKTLCLH